MNRFEKALEIVLSKDSADIRIIDALTACASGAFRIKPLVWVDETGNGITFIAKTFLGEIQVSEGYDDDFITYFPRPYDDERESYKTFDKAKAAAEAWYKEKLMQALEQVV